MREHCCDKASNEATYQRLARNFCYPERDGSRPLLAQRWAHASVERRATGVFSR